MRLSFLILLIFRTLLPVSPAETAPPGRGPEALVDGFVRAWNAHDGKLFGQLFAKDADWVTVGGAKLETRAPIQAFLEREHATWAKATTMTATQTEVRRLGTDVAVIHFNWEVAGAVDRQGTPTSPSRGVTLLVAVKEAADGWAIVAGQANRQAPAE